MQSANCLFVVWQVAWTPMPAEFNDTMVDIICCDCLEKSQVKGELVLLSHLLLSSHWRGMLFDRLLLSG